MSHKDDKTGEMTAVGESCTSFSSKFLEQVTIDFDSVNYFSWELDN